MQKSYLLLRDNIEKGPYTIDELLHQLQPSDLVWVEGESVVWAYPSEIKEINPGPDVPGNEAKAVKANHLKKFSPSGKTDEIEQRADEIRKRVLSSSSRYYANRLTKITATDNPQEVGWDTGIDIVYHKSKRNLVINQLMVAGILTLVASVGLYKMRTLFTEKPVVSSQATQVISTDEHTAKAQENQVPAIDSLAIAALPQTSFPAEKIKKPPVKKTEREAQPALNQTEIQPSLMVLGKTADQKNTEMENAITVQPAETKELLITAPKTTDVKESAVDEAADKKKTLGQALKGLFKKKKKEEIKTEAEVKTE
jgi:hypothetical protein